MALYHYAQETSIQPLLNIYGLIIQKTYLHSMEPHLLEIALVVLERLRLLLPIILQHQVAIYPWHHLVVTLIVIAIT